MRLIFLIFSTLILSVSALYSRQLNVGATQPYGTITAAANDALPGDSIVCHDAVIKGGMFIANLQGNANQWIHILVAENITSIIKGGNNSIQFSDAAYVHIEGFIIEGQTGNGLNIDDAGSFDTPTHHIRIVNCVIRDIDATGNNDLLKLSGLNDFEIKNCTFLNGSIGGSGIDMVGCHRGQIVGNSFKNMGTNSIQAKGGTADIKILRNFFENGGARAMNLGGSTGLSFFRPQNATAEAERIQVIANVIQGSEAAVAFVGSRNVEVSNNTILFPRKWILRILQETVDTTRFLPCGDNRFYNNLVIIDQNVSVDVNIGPNTAPETFTFENNLWWKTSNPSWNGPSLPGQVLGSIIADPLIIQNSLYQISSPSPAIAQGIPYSLTVLDIEGQAYKDPPSIGAFEGRKVISAVDGQIQTLINIYPNPTNELLNIKFPNEAIRSIMLYDLDGKLMSKYQTVTNHFEINVRALSSGMYILTIIDENGSTMSRKIVVQK